MHWLETKQSDVSISMLPNQHMHKVTFVVIFLYIHCCFLNCTTQLSISISNRTVRCQCILEAHNIVESIIEWASHYYHISAPIDFQQNFEKLQDVMPICLYITSSNLGHKLAPIMNICKFFSYHLIVKLFSYLVPL